MLIKAQKCPFSINQIVEFAIDINPNSLYPRTTWARFAEGQTTIGYKASDSDFGVVGASGGKKGHKMTLPNLIEHDHDGGEIGATSNVAWSNSGSDKQPDKGKTSKTGSNDPEPIPTLPPFVVTTKWRRTA